MDTMYCIAQDYAIKKQQKLQRNRLTINADI